MPDDSKVLPFRQTLTPGPSERTITVSYPHLLLLFDAFTHCATSLHEKLKLLDGVYAVLPGNDEIGLHKALAQNMNEKKALAQMLIDLRAMRAEAEQQAD